MSKSILQTDRECYLCGGQNILDEHHVFGAANRKKSEKYGLKVYLCHDSCHIFGKNSVHQNATVNNALQVKAQEKAMEHYGWSVDDFRNIFGKNYL